jgi:HAE1 family hydrophobic/amphiphilic exporter-1
MHIPVAALPSYNTPVINVNANLSGASPETMASSVALPLEKQFSTIAGINLITSTSTQGNTSLTLEFDPRSTSTGRGRRPGRAAGAPSASCRRK